MPNSKAIRNRIKSVKSTKKITKAMELVAASKMKRSVSQTLASRLYANYSWELLTSLSERMGDVSHPFFENEKLNEIKEKNNKKSLIILFTSNRGLCGGYNSQIIKRVISQLREKTLNIFDIVTVGKKGDSAMRRIGQNVIASFLEMPDINIKISDIIPLSTLITDEFKKRDYSSVYIAYTDFVSALSQKPKLRKLLPISKEELKEVIEEEGKGEGKGGGLDSNRVPFLFEGDVEKLIESLAEKLVRMQIYQMILESNASEQSSRMVAMKNANEAAGEMIDDLTLVFNKARQANITREISEISAGMASVS
jgi:F-type H+-transporting ATPase subunit gamma